MIYDTLNKFKISRPDDLMMITLAFNIINNSIGMMLDRTDFGSISLKFILGDPFFNSSRCRRRRCPERSFNWRKSLAFDEIGSPLTQHDDRGIRVTGYDLRHDWAIYYS